MDFQENINESYNIMYQEVGEVDDSVLILKDIDNKEEHRFYPEDVKKLRKFLNRLEEFGILKRDYL